MLERYSRQTGFPGLGTKGQARLAKSFAVIVGCGALGSVTATILVRAGVGRVRIIDPDFVEYHNLHRQAIFNEDDVRNRRPKASAAERYLKQVNSSVEIEGVAAGVNRENIEGLVRNADIILDGLDNFETRFLLNDVSLKYKIPWIYGGVTGSSGMTMNIIPGRSACLRCLYPEIPSPARLRTRHTAGVISPAPFVIGSLQATEAMKILVNAGEINRQLVSIDVWKNKHRHIEVARRTGCRSCEGVYEFLDGSHHPEEDLLKGSN